MVFELKEFVKNESCDGCFMTGIMMLGFKGTKSSLIIGELAGKLHGDFQVKRCFQNFKKLETFGKKFKRFKKLGSQIKFKNLIFFSNLKKCRKLHTSFCEF